MFRKDLHITSLSMATSVIGAAKLSCSENVNYLQTKITC